jgi:hypothetical protein
MPRGGKRPGAGRPVGSPSKATISANEQKAIAREVIREAIREQIPDIVRAQAENALGISYMVLRRPDGSYTEATDVAQLRAALAAGDSAFRIYTRQPHQGSAAMLLAYAADKPVEPVEMTGEGGGPIVVRWKE